MLYDRNIPIIQATAHRGSSAVDLIIDYGRLSDENKKVAKQLGLTPERIGYDSEGDLWGVRIQRKFPQASLATQISKWVCSRVSEFKTQPMTLASTYDLNTLKSMWGYSKDGSVTIADFERAGYVYDTTRRVFFESKEHHDKVTRNAAMATDTSKNGGIDLTRDKMGLEVQSEGPGVQFKFDPAMIQQLQNASGLTPVIIDIQPMTSTVSMFLGLKDNAPVGQLSMR